MKRVMVSAVAAIALLASCGGQAEVVTPAPSMPDPSIENRSGAEEPPAPGAEREPQAYVSAGRPGSADAYRDLVTRLEQLVPADLRSQVPWPDLRNPNPIVAQVEIFELWIWMTEFLPEPQLVEIMAARGSPSREEIVSVFGELDALDLLQRRPGQPYEAFDHLVVTFETAGLPLWLGRNVPEDAVVVYYRDSSGPVDVLDRNTRDIIDRLDPVPVRAWLSIMVPTEVGWQLWRDQLIEPNDSELQVPDLPLPPGADTDARKPEV